MKNYHAVVIEQSLKDKSVLGDFSIIDTKHSDNWDLDILEINNIEDAIKIIQPAMVSDKPYYWHIYDDNNTLVVVFKNMLFHLDPKDMSTWDEAQEYGAKLLNIPADQLDFYPTKFSDESTWLSQKD